MMNRSYIFCHMVISLDGKIMGDYMATPEGEIVAGFGTAEKGDVKSSPAMAEAYRLGQTI